MKYPLRPGSRIWLVRNYVPYCLEAHVVNTEWMLVSFEISSLSLSALEEKKGKTTRLFIILVFTYCRWSNIAFILLVLLLHKSYWGRNSFPFQVPNNLLFLIISNFFIEKNHLNYWLYKNFFHFFLPSLPPFLPSLFSIK